MRSREEVTKKNLEKLSERIAKRIDERGLNSSGSAKDSLEVKDNKLYGNDYIYFLDKGRRPGKFPPVQNMLEWVRRKLGITDESANSIAYLVGRKISREGTAIYKDNKKGLQLDELIDETIDDIIKELPEVAKVDALKWL